jgi:hypothetical protein
MHILRHIPVDRSAGPSIGEGTGSPERPRNDVQERDSEEEIHDHATREAEQNEVEESEERTEDDNTMAAVEIRRSGDESKDSEDDDTSEEEEDTSEEDDNGDGKEPSGITLHSESTHNTSGRRGVYRHIRWFLPSRQTVGSKARPRRNRRRPRRGRGRSRTVLRVERLRSVAAEPSR